MGNQLQKTISLVLMRSNSYVRQENGKELHVYQMDAASFPKEEAKNNKEFHDLWEKWHPNRVMRFLAKYECDKYISYVLFHHEKKK